MVDAFLEVIARIVADSSSHSLDRGGTRYSVCSSATRRKPQPGNPSSKGMEDGQVEDGRVVRPRSVMDAATDKMREGLGSDQRCRLGRFVSGSAKAHNRKNSSPGAAACKLMASCEEFVHGTRFRAAQSEKATPWAGLRCFT
jgi:hypothetical protein